MLLLGVPTLVFGAITASSQPIESRSEYLFIYHFNVGQGDSTLIVGPNGKSVLIDGGNRGQGRNTINKVLDEMGLSHIGGLDEVIESLTSVGMALDRGDLGHDNPTRQFNEWHSAAQSSRVGAYRPALAGSDDIDLGADVAVIVTSANGAVLGSDGTVTTPFEIAKRYENEKSVTVRLSFGCFDYFIGGDITGGGRSGSRVTPNLEAEIQDAVGDVDVLHVNHHGSQTSSHLEFLLTLDPEVAIISVGNGHPNTRYHHPARRVLDDFHTLQDERKHLRAIFQTNRGETDGGLTERDLELIRVADGHIVLFTNGEFYFVNGESFATDSACRSERADD